MATQIPYCNLRTTRLRDSNLQVSLHQPGGPKRGRRISLATDNSQHVLVC